MRVNSRKDSPKMFCPYTFTGTDKLSRLLRRKRLSHGIPEANGLIEGDIRPPDSAIRHLYERTGVRHELTRPLEHAIRCLSNPQFRHSNLCWALLDGFERSIERIWNPSLLRPGDGRLVQLSDLRRWSQWVDA